MLEWYAPFFCAKAQGKRECLHSHLPPHANVRNSQSVFLIVHQLGYSGNAYVYLGYLIPGWIIHDSCYRKTKDGLNLLDSSFCSGTEDSIYCDPRNGRISISDHIDLLLHLTNFLTTGTYFQVISRPRRWNSGNFLSSVDVHVIPIEIAKNFNRGVALIAQSF